MNMDYTKAINRIKEQALQERLQAEERRIIMDYTTAGKITMQGMNTTITALQAAATLNLPPTKPLVIANAATAAAIRKQFSREEVEIIITPVVETLTAYVVKDETLKSQLLAGIEQRGY